MEFAAEGAGTRSAVVLPGGQQGPFTPLLRYAADAAQDRGAQVKPIWWDDDTRPLRLSEEERTPWVTEHLVRALSEEAGT